MSTITDAFAGGVAVVSGRGLMQSLPVLLGVWKLALIVKQTQSSALTISSTTFFASPKTIMVLSM